MEADGEPAEIRTISKAELKIFLDQSSHIFQNLNSSDAVQIFKQYPQGELTFDDIPDRVDTEDLKRWGSLASAQCHVANAIFRWLGERGVHGRFLFCPTAYCGRMAGRNLGGEGYLSFSIAGPTGEGVTTPLTFTRERRCSLIDDLCILGKPRREAAPKFMGVGENAEANR